MGPRTKVQGRFSVGEETHEFRLITAEDGSLYRDSRGRDYLLCMSEGHVGWFYPTASGIGGTFALRVEGEPAVARWYVWLKEGDGTIVVYPSATRD
jgi:hypothetical protein